jgi:endo-1,4-beta-xylanase
MPRPSALGALAAGLLGTALLTVSLTAPATAGSRVPDSTTVGARVPDPTTSTLRQLAAHTGMRIGTAVDTSALANDPTYRAAVGAEFNTVTPENVMKWDTVEPQQGQFNFTQADTLVAFARAHGQKVRGHTLVWHSQLPAWVTSRTWTAAELRPVLRNHILTEVGHFRGRIWAWDVVNEAFNEDGTLRDTIWRQVLGDRYIADAFRWAHQADPNAILFYNDFNIEGLNPKSDAVFALLTRLRSEGVPVQAVGAQGHLDTRFPVPTGIVQNLRRFAAAGMYSAITEADVRSVLPVDATETAAQTAGYTTMLQGCLLVRRCLSFTVWGFTDKYQWVPSVFPDEGEAAIWDANFQPKPAYDQMRIDLALAPSGWPRG